VAVTALLVALSFTVASSESTASVGNADISQQFEQALLASVEQLEGIQ